MLSKRLIAAVLTTGVAATLPVMAAGAASAHTASAAPAAKPVVQAVAPVQVKQTAAPQAATVQHTAPVTYTVASGDYLSKIATKHNVQGGWQKLYDMNKSVLTKGPNLIFPGQHLVLSGGTTVTVPAAVSTPAPAAKPAAKPAVKPAAPVAKHTVQAPKAQAAKPAKPAPKAVAHTSTVNAAPVSFAATGSPQQIAAQLVPANQLASFDQIISHESGWNVHATNPSSGAYGLGQALPGSKMASAGADWRNNPTTQIKWALDYMNSRYGSPNAAWAFWQTHHWY